MIDMWLAAAFGSALFAGITSVLAKCGIKKADPDAVTALRTAAVLVFAWLMVFITGAWQGIENVSPKTWVFLVLSGLATGASWICYFRALRLGDVNKVVSVDKSSTVLTIILAVIFLGESLTPLKAVGAAAAAAGTYVMTGKKENSETGKGSRMWLVYAILSAVFASLTSILGKVGIEGVDSNLGTAVRTTVVLAAAWGIVFARGKAAEVKKIGGRELLFVLLSGAATGASWLCYYSALKNGPASIVVSVDKLSVLFTALFSRVILGERLNKRSGAGLALITAGTLAMIF